MQTSAAPARNRLARRLLIGALVLLLVLLGLDRLGNYVAEQTAATTIQRSAHLDSEPDVAIGGFPFLTQLAAGRFDEITVTVHGVEVGSGGVGVHVARLVVVLHTVRVSRDLHSVRADSATAAGLITYPDLSRSLDAQVSYAGQGRVRASKTLTVAGHTFGGTITAEPHLAGQSLSFGKVATGQLGRLAVLALSQVFDTRVSLAGLPLQVSLQGLSADRAGIHLALGGTGLSFTR